MNDICVAKFPPPEFCTILYTADLENFVVKKVTCDKNSVCFNFVKTESIVSGAYKRHKVASQRL